MLNKAILIGRFTRDPELRSTPQGTSTCSFTIAVDRNYVSAGAERQADFISCVAWRQTAEFISKYFSKGNLICIEGTIQTRNWKGNDGVTHYVTEVVVDRAYFVESKKSREQNNQGYSQPADYGQQPYGAQNSYSQQQPYPQQSAQSYNDSPFGSLPDPMSPLAADDDLPF